jgi:hypothetical protein
MDSVQYIKNIALFIQRNFIFDVAYSYPMPISIGEVWVKQVIFSHLNFWSLLQHCMSLLKWKWWPNCFQKYSTSFQGNARGGICEKRMRILIFVMKLWHSLSAASSLCNVLPVGYIDTKNLNIKGIVSWGWGGLLMVLVDRYKVPIQSQNTYF